LAIGGVFAGIVDFDPGTVKEEKSTAKSGMFLTKWSNNAVFQWVNMIEVSANSTSFIRKIGFDGMNNISISGTFTDSVDFDPRWGISNKLGSGIYTSSVFNVKYDNLGALLIARKTIGSNKLPITLGGSILSNSGALYEFGGFGDSVYFFDSKPSNLVVSSGFGDGFIQKITCDLDNKIQAIGNTLKATKSGIKYQWISCSDNKPIAGETNQTFIPKVNGNYAVYVSVNGCTKLSKCGHLPSMKLRMQLPYRLRFTRIRQMIYCKL